MRTTTKGLVVWDLSTDQFSHTQLAGNWDLIDSLLGAPSQSVETLASLPVTNLFSGRLVMLSAANGGFAAWTLVLYNGSAWRPVGYETLGAVPGSGNFAGRLVLLSASSGGFPQWSLIRYDGSAWDIVGGFTTVTTGGGALNLLGRQINQDIYIGDANRGLVLIDRATSTLYRIYFKNGTLQTEVIT